MDVFYTHNFIKKLNSLPFDLQGEIVEKISLFKDRKNHKNLRVHKLHGSLADRFSFYVNYKVRIVFQYLDKNSALLLAVGDHDIYK